MWKIFSKRRLELHLETEGEGRDKQSPGDFVANKFCRGQLLLRKFLVVFLKIARKKLVGFFPVPIRKYIRNKGNGAEGAEDFRQEKFSAGKIWWVF